MLIQIAKLFIFFECSQIVLTAELYFHDPTSNSIELSEHSAVVQGYSLLVCSTELDFELHFYGHPSNSFGLREHSAVFQDNSIAH